MRAHVKGIFFAVTITMVGVLAIAFGLTSFGLGETTIITAMQVLKVLAIFIGVMIVSRRLDNRAWLHGGLLGIIYTAVTFLILSIIAGGSFDIAEGFLFEAIFAVIVGIMSAILLRLRKREV